MPRLNTAVSATMDTCVRDVPAMLSASCSGIFLDPATTGFTTRSRSTVGPLHAGRETVPIVSPVGVTEGRGDYSRGRRGARRRRAPALQWPCGAASLLRILTGEPGLDRGQFQGAR